VPRELYAHGFFATRKAPRSTRPTGELWTVEHGPQGGDELNIVRPGHDYGWPDVFLRTQYDARPHRRRQKRASRQRRHSMPASTSRSYFWCRRSRRRAWRSTRRTCSRKWKGNLFVGALAGQHLVRLVLNGDRVVAEEALLTDLKLRDP